MLFEKSRAYSQRNIFFCRVIAMIVQNTQVVLMYYIYRLHSDKLPLQLFIFLKLNISLI